MRKPKQKRSQETLERILHAAVDLFDRSGVDATGITEIAEHAKASVGSLYGRFDGKTDLVLAVDGLLWDRVIKRWREAPAASGATRADPSSTEPVETDVLLAELRHALAPERNARASTKEYLGKEGLVGAGPAATEALVEDVARVLAARASRGTDLAPQTDALRYLARLTVSEVESGEHRSGVGEELLYVIDATIGALSGSTAGGTPPAAGREPPPTDPFDIWA